MGQPVRVQVPPSAMDGPSGDGRPVRLWPRMPARLISRSPGRAVALAALVVTAAVWGITFPIVRRAVADFPPIDFLAVRFLFASALLAPFVRARGGWAALLPRSALIPGACLALGYTLQTEGLRTVGSAPSAFLTGTSVILVSVLGRTLGWERPGPRGWIAVWIALGGIYLLEGRLPGRWSRGETLTAGCAVAFAMQILILGRISRRETGPLELGAGQIHVATLLLCGLALIHPDRMVSSGLTRGVLMSAALTGLLATAAAFVVQVWAQRIVPARDAAICFAAEPLCAALYAAAFFGESMPMRGWIGAMAILAAILLVAFDARRETTAASVEERGRVC
jgi:drug/metabolite transporter (DMT)-like permease